MGLARGRRGAGEWFGRPGWQSPSGGVKNVEKKKFRFSALNKSDNIEKN